MVADRTQRLCVLDRMPPRGDRSYNHGGMTAKDDISSVAEQLAQLTRAVEEMANQLVKLRERADTQQERIDLAARELTEVSDRLQAAANALRETV
jgi:methyl-accepting chemotaxis protein